MGAAMVLFNGKLYAERPYTTSTFKFNAPQPGTYTFDGPGLTLAKTEPLQIIDKGIVLPAPDRNKKMGVKAVHFDNSSNSPARIYTDKQIICINSRFLKMPIEVRMFILLHEAGHFLYAEEWKCDTFAAYHFLKMGFNPSQAFESLSGVLHPGEKNDQRIDHIYNLLSK